MCWFKRVSEAEATLNRHVRRKLTVLGSMDYLKISQFLLRLVFFHHQVMAAHAFRTSIPVLEVICIEQLGLILLQGG